MPFSRNESPLGSRCFSRSGSKLALSFHCACVPCSSRDLDLLVVADAELGLVVHGPRTGRGGGRTRARRPRRSAGSPSSPGPACAVSPPACRSMRPRIASVAEAAAPASEVMRPTWQMKNPAFRAFTGQRSVADAITDAPKSAMSSANGSPWKMSSKPQRDDEPADGAVARRGRTAAGFICRMSVPSIAITASTKSSVAMNRNPRDRLAQPAAARRSRARTRRGSRGTRPRRA